MTRFKKLMLGLLIIAMFVPLAVLNTGCGRTPNNVDTPDIPGMPNLGPGTSLSGKDAEDVLDKIFENGATNWFMATHAVITQTQGAKSMTITIFDIIQRNGNIASRFFEDKEVFGDYTDHWSGKEIAYFDEANARVYIYERRFDFKDCEECEGAGRVEKGDDWEDCADCDGRGEFQLETYSWSRWYESVNVSTFCFNAWLLQDFSFDIADYGQIQSDRLVVTINESGYRSCRGCNICETFNWQPCEDPRSETWSVSCGECYDCWYGDSYDCRYIVEYTDTWRCGRCDACRADTGCQTKVYVSEVVNGHLSFGNAQTITRPNVA